MKQFGFLKNYKSNKLLEETVNSGEEKMIPGNVLCTLTRSAFIFYSFSCIIHLGLSLKKTTKFSERPGSAKAVNVHPHVRAVTQSIYLAVLLLLVNIPAPRCSAFSTALRNCLDLWAEGH